MWFSLGLDLVTLRMFLSIADEGSLGRAATREGIALSAISRRISDLEARTGLVLFDRRDRGMTLTCAGRTLAEHIRGLFDRLDDLALELDALRGGEKGHVRLCHMTAAAGLLPSRLARFLADNPGVGLEVDETSAEEALHAVRVGEADIGVITSGTPAANDLHLYPWVEDELVAIVPRGHALAQKARLSLSDICAYPLVTLRHSTAILALYQERARTLGLEINERVHATSYESVRAMVAGGLGVAIVPAHTAYPHAREQNIEVRALSETWAQRRLVICVRHPDHLSASADLVVRHLLASVEEATDLASGPRALAGVAAA
jgi:DNA-binding transcriptional LysR family regulator